MYIFLALLSVVGNAVATYTFGNLGNHNELEILSCLESCGIDCDVYVHVDDVLFKDHISIVTLYSCIEDHNRADKCFSQCLFGEYDIRRLSLLTDEAYMRVVGYDSALYGLRAIGSDIDHYTPWPDTDDEEWEGGEDAVSDGISG
ncbi:CIC11C00000003832 [Sungouiella intermedia]|uniref:CIC11C00000003832 n=1 Tax=Sungouiella intermedia TaxID=45354 RepID=A0A1L0B9K3_9ASCO|nr:CIC11C00000003832 [[Candida] intermedia]